MEYINFAWDNTFLIVQFLVLLTVLVFVHELGHYLIARRNNVRVEVFSIGFGPEIHGWTDSVGTRWKISAVPLGGYVKMFGEDEAFFDDEEKEKATPLSDEDRAVSFPHKPLGQRSAIVVAGPVANFIFAIVVLTGLFWAVGNPAPMSGIGRVQPQSAAENAGLQKGDRVLSIDGEDIQLFEDLRRIVSANPETAISLLVLRGDKELTISATPVRRKAIDLEGNEVEIGLLGVAPDPEQISYESVGPFGAGWLAVKKSYGLSKQILQALGELISGQRDTKELGGPIRIAQISGQMADAGLVEWFFFMAALSVNLCLINLFPIPMLDGGHLFFYSVEFVLGKPLSPRIQEYGFRFGLILVLLLMVFATWNDLVQLKVFEFIKQLIT